MLTTTAQRLRQTVILVENRVREGKSEDAIEDLKFLTEQYSLNRQWDKANCASRYMVAIAEGRTDTTFDVLPEDLDYHLSRKYLLARSTRRAVTMLIVGSLMSLALLWAFCSNIFATNHSYAFSVKVVSPDELEVLRLYDQTSGRTIWTRKVYNHSYIGWSRDRQGLCVGVTTVDNEPSILVWHVDRPVEIVSYDDDYMLEGIVWSPDSKHVLFRTGFSGACDMDEGTLRCLNVRNCEISTLNLKLEIHRMLWADSHKVLYWRGCVSDGKVDEDKNPSIWRVP